MVEAAGSGPKPIPALPGGARGVGRPRTLTVTVRRNEQLRDTLMSHALVVGVPSRGQFWDPKRGSQRAEPMTTGTRPQGAT